MAAKIAAYVGRLHGRHCLPDTSRDRDAAALAAKPSVCNEAEMSCSSCAKVQRTPPVVMPRS